MWRRIQCYIGGYVPLNSHAVRSSSNSLSEEEASFKNDVEKVTNAQALSSVGSAPSLSQQRSSRAIGALNSAPQATYRPLTVADVVRETTLQTLKINVFGPNLSLRQFSGRKFFRLEGLGKLDLVELVERINNESQKIRNLVPDTSQRLTLVCMESRGLFAVYLLYKELKKLGYVDTHWRLIDLWYGKKSFCFSPTSKITYEIVWRAVSEFSNDTPDVEFFTTGGAYVKTKINGVSLVESDRAQGALIPISLDCPQPSKNLVSHPGKYIILNGRLAEANDANCLYLINRDYEYGRYKDAILELKKNLDQGAVISDRAIKIFLNANGTLGFDYPQHSEYCQRVVYWLRRTFPQSFSQIDDFLREIDGRRLGYFSEAIDGYAIRFRVYPAYEYIREFQNFSLPENLN